jgi:acetyl-CoA carboxylase biotin carboxyl carrier protein
MDGRMFRRELVVKSRATDDGVELFAPMPGIWREAPAHGDPIGPGGRIGVLEVLGVLHELRAPADVEGVVDSDAPRLGERPVAYGDVLVRLVAPTTTTRTKANAVRTDAAAVSDKLVFRAPLSGRYYARPSPDKPPFVQLGSEVGPGQTIALLEVMKTFNRLTYGGAGLPERARVVAVLARDEDDVDAGTPILELEPLA